MVFFFFFFFLKDIFHSHGSRYLIKTEVLKLLSNIEILPKGKFSVGLILMILITRQAKREQAEAC